LWDECDAQACEGAQGEPNWAPDWDGAAQPAPDYEVDKRINQLVSDRSSDFASTAGCGCVRRQTQTQLWISGQDFKLPRPLKLPRLEAMVAQN